jgi:TusA-related sulfurtransferase
MATIELDITGQGCPYALLITKKQLTKLASGDVLVVKCDHPPAARENIPAAMRELGYPLESTILSPGLWELKITKK